MVVTLYQLIEYTDLILQPQPPVICLEEVRVLFLEFLPDEPCEARGDFRLLFDYGQNLALVHVQLKTSLDKVLDELYVE